MYEDAIKMAKESLTYEKNNPKAYYRISQAYKELKDLDRAKENLLKAINLVPNDQKMR